MGKNHNSKDLQTRRISRSLLAVTLAASLAAFGCTTNLNPGNGTPTRSGPEIRTLPTTGISGASESVPPPPPMTSSYTKSEAMPRVTPRSIRRSADEAIAIMADQQPVRGRYLGPANPGSGGRPYASDNAGGFVNPALLTNPQLTINSTISSPSTVAINNGAGGLGTTGGAVLGATGLTTGSGTTAAATVAGTGALATGDSTAVTAGGTTGVGLTAGTFASARPAVTESISNNPAVTPASLGLGRTGAGVVRGGTTVVGTGTNVTTTTNNNATIDTTATAPGTATTAATSAVRILRGNNGSVTITNTNANTNTRSQ
jgi:hypothetical protein